MATTRTLAFDIECIADPAVLATYGPALAEMGVKREQDAATFAALCPPLARVIAVSFCNPETEKTGVIYDTALCGPCEAREDVQVIRVADEPSVLAETFRILDCYGRLVSFAGNLYDLPVLSHRARICGVKVAQIVEWALAQKPWETNIHVDLQREMSFGTSGRFPLRAYALAYGLADPKAEGDGGRVAEIVAARDAERLVTYAAGDARTTAALWRRWNPS